jgi:hypothetical protein
LIIAFDEHRVSSNFKFGILLQKEGQVYFLKTLWNTFYYYVQTVPSIVEMCLYVQFTEEDILSNTEETQEFQEFLSILGETVKLQGFTG